MALLISNFIKCQRINRRWNSQQNQIFLHTFQTNTARVTILDRCISLKSVQIFLVLLGVVDTYVPPSVKAWFRFQLPTFKSYPKLNLLTVYGLRKKQFRCLLRRDAMSQEKLICYTSREPTTRVVV